ncbi:winged helix-turn-helix domain-containing protein [Gallaecimonas mangrovi]|uniref:winged helix-turn-helix domain-containing protein n=1 Tax=Gallaecimonas mangrovi TaxID=2291597 RepID=UPI000E1FD081|nr:crosslink repair DNA glycosylase YcaQ family protein [Gallaecimonas mangrovi]
MDSSRLKVLAGQHLYEPWKGSLSGLISHLGAVQLDAIQVISRAHHHQLFNRVAHYQESQLADAEAKREIFEYWSHAAAYLPMTSYPYARVRMDRIREGQRHWFEKNAKLCRYVLDRIRAEGQLKASDFVKAKGGWWQWSDEKKALEQLFHEGELMVSHRDGFQKVFDLPERILPSDTVTERASDLDYGCYLVRTFLRCQAFGRVEEIAYLRPGDKTLVKDAVAAMRKSGEVIEQNGELMLHCAESVPPKKAPRQVRLLSPFDPLILQRKRLNRLFDFQYQLECYLPAPKRRFGYFALPILYGDKLVGVVDLKADRPNNQLLVKALHWQKKPGSGLLGSFNKALADFARFHGIKEVVFV